MNKSLYFTLIIALLIMSSFALHAQKKLNALFSYATFRTVADGPFVETYLLVDGKSVQYVASENGKFRAAIEISMIFSQHDSVVTFKKYDLLSPETGDTANIAFSFLDLQRVLIPNGQYDMELSIADKNATAKPYSNVEKITIEYNDDIINISDIQLVESMKKTETQNVLSKAGYDIIPYIMNYYPKSIEKVSFYTEIYNTESVMGKEVPFLINYYLESWESQMPLTQYNWRKREVARETNVLLGEFSIKDLPSGNYSLVVSVRDKNNSEKAVKKFFFYRNNPGIAYNENDLENLDVNTLFVNRMTSNDTLRDYINALYPISTEMERIYAQNILLKDDLSSMQKYFYNFWANRNTIDPERAWRDYAEVLNMVNNSFKTGNRKGYETDRGRVYLQYGAPNSMSKSELEPSAYPYEIWHYYTLRNQSNRKFVFYSREFSTNDYELIHSDALGEINDPRWQVKIHNRDTPANSLDPEDAEKHWGGRIDDYYKNPR